jgi:hypothetical protein
MEDEMGNVIDLNKYRKKKQEVNKDEFRRSLDNDEVKRRYKIKEPTPDERWNKISERIKRINSLMKELEENNR